MIPSCLISPIFFSLSESLFELQQKAFVSVRLNLTLCLISESLSRLSDSFFNFPCVLINRISNVELLICYNTLHTTPQGNETFNPKPTIKTQENRAIPSVKDVLACQALYRLFEVILGRCVKRFWIHGLRFKGNRHRLLIFQHL